jgi:hypothetical protein
VKTSFKESQLTQKCKKKSILLIKRIRNLQSKNLILASVSLRKMITIKIQMIKISLKGKKSPNKKPNMIKMIFLIN